MFGDGIANLFWMLSVVIPFWMMATNEGHAQEQSLTIASVQYPVEGNKTLEEILAKVEAFTEEAVAKKVDVLVLPELLTLDAWPVQEGAEETIESERKVVQEIASKITPGYFAGIRQLAKKHHIAIMAGSSPELDVESKKLFNVALLVQADGKELIQKKIHPTKWERDIGIASGKEITIADTPWGKTAILVCYDVEFPDLSAVLVEKSPMLILVPSMTESEAGLKRVRWTSQARAIEHHAIVVVSGTVGHPMPTWQLFGQSAILGPASETFAMNDVEGTINTRGMIIQTIDLKALTYSREQTHYHPAKDKREKTSGD
jgi:predicted amidohydrolase